MNLVFVHGRAQGGRTQAEIVDEWLGGLKNGLANAGRGPLTQQPILPFYGDTLDQLTAQLHDSAIDIVFRGEQDPLAALDDFEDEFLHEIASRAGLTSDALEAEMEPGVVQRGPQNCEWVQALGKAVDRHVGWLSNVTMHTITRDVRAYLTKRKVRRAVHDIIRPALTAGECVVVAHSLGSVVAYWLLRDLGNEAKVPLLVTAGSPLGMRSVKKRLERPLGGPAGVTSWFNVADPRDPVALHETLHGDTFPADIDNLIIDNPDPDDPHSIAGYLTDGRVAARIAEALGI